MSRCKSCPSHNYAIVEEYKPFGISVPERFFDLLLVFLRRASGYLLEQAAEVELIRVADSLADFFDGEIAILGEQILRFVNP